MGMMGIARGQDLVPVLILFQIFGFAYGLFVMDKSLDPVEAVKTSWRMTHGYGWTIFFMAVVSFFIIIGGLILLILMVIPAAMCISSAFASLYYAVDTVHQNEES